MTLEQIMAKFADTLYEIEHVANEDGWYPLTKANGNMQHILEANGKERKEISIEISLVYSQDTGEPSEKDVRLFTVGEVEHLKSET